MSFDYADYKSYDNDSTLQMSNSRNNYPWPGNVRELQHSIERAVIMSDSEVLSADDFMIKEKKNNTSAAPTSLKVEDMEKEAILKAIAQHRGNLTSAA